MESITKREFFHTANRSVDIYMERKELVLKVFADLIFTRWNLLVKMIAGFAVEFKEAGSWWYTESFLIPKGVEIVFERATELESDTN